MKTFTAVVEKCSATGMFIGYMPGFPGAHSQGVTPDELRKNMKEVVEMLLEGGQPRFEAEIEGNFIR
jgi:predicted RNase H-like HicB family nuclease